MPGRATGARQASSARGSRPCPTPRPGRHYSKTVGTDELGKFIIDVKTNDIYFFDVNLFNIHADFVLGVLLKQAWTADNIREYNKNYERVKPKFILGYLTHHLKIDKWTFSFWEGDKIGPDDVMRVKKRLDADVLPEEHAVPARLADAAEGRAARSPSAGLKIDHQRRDLQGGRVPGVHQGPRGRQAPRRAGRHAVRVARCSIATTSCCSRRAIPTSRRSPGILATAFSTPLSHVNLRAGAWGIPNAGDKKAREKYGKLDGKIVYYEVTDTAMTLREATAEEIKELEDQDRGRQARRAAAGEPRQPDGSRC